MWGALGCPLYPAPTMGSSSMSSLLLRQITKGPGEKAEMLSPKMANNRSSEDKAPSRLSKGRQA
jgi:hypothetical protein